MRKRNIKRAPQSTQGGVYKEHQQKERGANKKHPPQLGPTQSTKATLEEEPIKKLDHAQRLQ